MTEESIAPTGLPRVQGVALAAARFLSRAGLTLLLLYAAATLVDGLLRSLANAPIDAVRDLGELVVAVAISCCFPQGFLERRNIVISFIESIIGARGAASLDALAAVLVAGVLLLLAWQFGVYARGLARAEEMTALLEIPKAPFWVVVDVNLWLTFVAQLIVVASTFVAAPQTKEA